MEDSDARERLDDLEARETALLALAGSRAETVAGAHRLADLLLRQLNKPDYKFLARYDLEDAEPSPEAGAEAVKAALAEIDDSDTLLLCRIRARSYLNLNRRDGLASLLVELITERLLVI